MKIFVCNIHVPFAELPLEVHFLLLLGATAAILRLWPWSPTTTELREALTAIWNREKFTPEDAIDFPLMANRLDPLLAEFAAKGAGERASRRRLKRRGIQ